MEDKRRGCADGYASSTEALPGVAGLHRWRELVPKHLPEDFGAS
jgi:hypothetical protein